MGWKCVWDPCYRWASQKCPGLVHHRQKGLFKDLVKCCGTPYPQYPNSGRFTVAGAKEWMKVAVVPAIKVCLQPCDFEEQTL